MRDISALLILPPSALSGETFHSRDHLDKPIFALRKLVDSSRIRVMVIPTNEELLIARDTFRAVRGLPNPH